GLEEVPLTVRLEAGVSASPMVKPIGPVDVPCTMVLFGMSDMTGGELPDDLTVRTNVVLDASEPSLTLTVTVAVPNLSAAGVAVIGYGGFDAVGRYIEGERGIAAGSHGPFKPDVVGGIGGDSSGAAGVG